MSYRESYFENIVEMRWAPINVVFHPCVSVSVIECLLSIGVVLLWMQHELGHPNFGVPRRVQT